MPKSQAGIGIGKGKTQILAQGNLAIKKPNNDDTPLLAPIIGLSSKLVLD